MVHSRHMFTRHAPYYTRRAGANYIRMLHNELNMQFVAVTC